MPTTLYAYVVATFDEGTLNATSNNASERGGLNYIRQ